MRYLTYCHFFCFIVYIFLAAYLIIKNRRSSLNRANAAMMLSFAVWSFGEVFVHNIWVTRKTATLFECIGSIGWTGFGGFYLWFAAVFAGRFAFARSRTFLAAIIAMPLIFLYGQWSGHIVSDHELKSFGWIGKWSASAWTYLYYCYYFIVVVVGFMLIIRCRMVTDDPLKRRQADIILWCGMPLLLIGSIFNVVFRQLGIYDIPPIADIFILVWAAGMVYAIVRYRFFVITPGMATDEIVSTMQEILLLLDPLGRIASVNRAALAVLGYEKEEIEGRPAGSVLSCGAAEESFPDKIISGSPVKGWEVFLVTRTGKRIPISLNSTPLPGAGTVIIARDITEQRNATKALQMAKEELEQRVEERTIELHATNIDLQSEIAVRRRTEEHLRDSEKRLGILFESAPDAYYLNDMSGTFIDGNKRAEELTGYRKDELVGTSFLKLNLLSASQIPKAAKLLALNVLGRSTGPDEFVLARKDGASIAVEISTHPVRIADKALVLGIARDVSPRRKMEEEKSRLEAQLHQAQKMEAIGQLAGGIAHDFNNMLAAIVGYADLIVNGFSSDNPKLARYATGIRDTGMRAADLTTKLLAFARKGKLESVPVNMHEAVQAAASLFEPSLPKNITLTQHFAANPPTVTGDRTQLQNMVLNLAINAKDAMPNGGQLSIATENSIIDEEYAKSKPYHVVPGDYLKLSVMDTGMGMDEETKLRIFEPFFTTKEKGKGTGLGLASVYGTVKHHGGYIEVTSSFGKGTMFCILLPVAGKQEEKSVPASTPLLKGTGNILLVDDDPEVREMASDVLANLGYIVQAATNGKEAVEYFQVHTHETDLVILDMVMPVMGGYECFTELRKLNPAVRVLVSSGYATSHETGRILRENGTGFIQKPYDMARLSKAAAEALSGLRDQTPGAKS